MSSRASTPARISRSTADALADGTIARQSVTLHSRDAPCGLLNIDESVAMPAEDVVDALDDRDVAVRSCDHCGAHLRVVSDNGDR